jgi:hypothetical protein
MANLAPIALLYQYRQWEMPRHCQRISIKITAHAAICFRRQATISGPLEAALIAGYYPLL